MRPRRAFQPSLSTALEGRMAPGGLGLPAHHAAHVKPHVQKARVPRPVARAHPAAKAEPTPAARIVAVDAGTGPVVGGTIGTGAGATLDPTFTYLLPVAAFGEGVAGNPYGGLSNGPTINSLNGGGPGNLNTLNSGLGPRARLAGVRPVLIEAWLERQRVRIPSNHRPAMKVCPCDRPSIGVEGRPASLRGSHEEREEGAGQPPAGHDFRRAKALSGRPLVIEAFSEPLREFLRPASVGFYAGAAEGLDGVPGCPVL